MNLNCDFRCPKCQSSQINIIITKNEMDIVGVEDSAVQFLMDEKNAHMTGFMRIILKKESSYMLCNSCKHRWNVKQIFQKDSKPSSRLS